MRRLVWLATGLILAALALPLAAPLAAAADPGRTDWVIDPAWYEGDSAWNTIYGLSDDGRFALAGMTDPDYPYGDGSGGGLVVRDMIEGWVLPITQHYSATSPPAPTDPVLSGDGQAAVFWSQRWDLDPAHPESPADQDFDLFVADWPAGTIRRVTSPPLDAESTSAVWPSEASISVDGRYVLYTTNRRTITDRGISDPGGYDQLYRWDALTGLNTVVASRNGKDAFASGDATMSSDGRFVVFLAAMDGPTPGAGGAPPNPPQSDLYEKDMVSGRLWNISRGRPAGNDPLVSDDGSVVVFEAGDVYPLTGLADANRLTDIVRWTRSNDHMELISRSSDGLAAAAGWSELTSLSADGSTVVFLSSAENLIAGIDDPNNPKPGGPMPGLDVHWTDAYAWRNGEMVLVSRSAGRNSTGNRGVTSVDLSRDGSTVAFESEASDLLSDGSDHNETLPCRSDIFAFSFATKSTRPASVVDDAAGYRVPGCSSRPLVSENGSLVAFEWQETWVYEGRNARFVARRAMNPPFPPPPPDEDGADSELDPDLISGGTGGPPPGAAGYWALSGNGTVYAFGAAPTRGFGPGGGAVDIEPVPGGSYLILTSAGAVSAQGPARAFGGLTAGTLKAGERAASLSALPDGSGYWIFTDAGRVFPFGSARSFGDLGNLRLNGPVLDSVATPSGNGYFMVASDGGVFTFGDARFVGSTGGLRLNAPVRSLVPDADGTGYWLVASDGGIFAFDAAFRGSLGGVRLNRPIRGWSATATATSWWVRTAASSSSATSPFSVPWDRTLPRVRSSQ